MPIITAYLSQIFSLYCQFFSYCIEASLILCRSSVIRISINFFINCFVITEWCARQDSIGPVNNEAVQEWLDNMTYDKKGLIHLFSWSGLIDTNMLLQDVFRVPNLETGTMEPIISSLTQTEEEMFQNMMRRLHIIFQVRID